MEDVGLKAEWQVIKGSDDFFNVTKSIHNGLQGMDVSFTKEMKEIFVYIMACRGWMSPLPKG